MPLETDSDYETKNYSLDFFSGFVARGSSVCIFEEFEKLASCDKMPVLTLGRFYYQLRDLSCNIDTITGVLAKFRTTDIPYAGGLDGTERELELGEKEGLIEKNYFMVKKDCCIVVFQRNGHAARIGRLSEYLTSVCGETVTFNPVLQPDSMERMLNDDLKPVSIELSFATPTNPDFYPANDWGRTLGDIADIASGSRLKINISADRRATNENEHTLASGTKQFLKSFVDKGIARVAKAKLTDGFCDYPIDLIADRLSDEVSVKVRGHYPISDDMFSSLKNAYQRRKGDIDEIFGEQGRRLS